MPIVAAEREDSNRREHRSLTYDDKHDIFVQR
jgi:hypothetical protein